MIKMCDLLSWNMQLANSLKNNRAVCYSMQLYTK